MGDKIIPKYIKKHEDYDPMFGENDIALLKTSTIIFNSTKINTLLKTNL